MDNSLLTLKETLTATGGQCIAGREEGQFSFSSVATDSRNCIKGSCFIPLRGEQDGHKYLQAAIANGASVLVIDKEGENEYKNIVLDKLDKGVSVIVVEKTLKALQKMAEFYVSKFPNLIKIAITGSSGKTTTKDLIASVLSEKFKVVATKGNFNSMTGLPLSVFNIRKEHQFGVFEMGMNQKDEIKESSEVLKAPYALITNIGTAHIGILGSMEEIAKEKKHIADYITKDGALFINENTEFYDYLVKDCPGRVMKFGTLSAKEALKVKYLKDNGVKGHTFSLDNLTINLHLSGVYNYINALAALTVGSYFGLDNKAIKRGLEKVVSKEGRMDIEEAKLKTEKSVTLIKDYYNANPVSMRLSLEFCHSLIKENKSDKVKKVIYILGDMLELGEKEEEAHSAIGAIVAQNKPSYCIFYGEAMNAAYKKAVERGFRECVYIKDAGEKGIKNIADTILKEATDRAIILLKASRGLTLERVLPLILEDKKEKLEDKKDKVEGKE